MTPTRIYIRLRRAWTPRLWPMFLATGALTAAVVLLLAPGALAGAGIGVGVGLGLGLGRWEIWKRRHPVITPDQYITDLLRDIRETARWN